MRLLKTVESFLRDDGWDFAPIDSRTVLKTGYQGEHGSWTCYAQTREDDQQFLFYAICPIKAPDKKRAAVAEFITRANYGMVIGNFEMDYEDGEVRFKCSIDLEGSDLTEPLVRSAVYWAVMMMDKYLPGLLKVIGGTTAPADAIDDIEAEDHKDPTKS